MNRRGVLSGLLAGAAIATGLARTKLELVDDDATFAAMDLAWRVVAHDHSSVYFMGRDGMYAFTDEDALESNAPRRISHVPPHSLEIRPTAGTTPPIDQATYRWWRMEDPHA